MSRSAAALLLDIEGTTTPVSFVYEVLFPFARTRLRAFLKSHFESEGIQNDIHGLIEEHSHDIAKGLSPAPIKMPSSSDDIESVAEYAHWLMDQDRKSTPLKSLQGRIWKDGYETGELKSQIFPDVAAALERWTNEGKQVSIFSSGSVLAQKLLFANTPDGDLTRFISHYFDTNFGAKIESGSYQRIAEQLGLPPDEIQFVSDVIPELEAAAGAGMKTALAVRPGNPPQDNSDGYPVIRSFDEL